VRTLNNCEIHNDCLGIPLSSMIIYFLARRTKKETSNSAVSEVIATRL
jgi:hypothetical protein